MKKQTLIEKVGIEMNANGCDGYVITDQSGILIASFVQCLNTESKRASKVFAMDKNAIIHISAETEKYGGKLLLVTAAVECQNL